MQTVEKILWKRNEFTMTSFVARLARSLLIAHSSYAELSLRYVARSHAGQVGARKHLW